MLPGEQLASIDGTAHRWLVDRKGTPRVAWRRDDEGYTLLTRGPDQRRFREIYRYEDDEDERQLKPMYLSSDESKIIVAAYAGKNTMGLHELDPETGEFAETLFYRDDVDVVGVRIDDQTHEIIAATYELEGEPRFHYFEAYRNRFLDGLQKELPVEKIDAATGTSDGRFFVYRVFGPTNPGEYFFRDTYRRSSVSIAKVAMEIDRASLSYTESFVVESRDGTKIEAYLTLPAQPWRPGSDGRDAPRRPA